MSILIHYQCSLMVILHAFQDGSVSAVDQAEVIRIARPVDLMHVPGEAVLEGSIGNDCARSFSLTPVC